MSNRRGILTTEPTVAGSKQLRDITTKVRIKFLVSGRFPGDGSPQPVAFPDPAMASIDIEGIRYLRLETLIELNLASGITGGIRRLKDIAAAVELIHALKLPASYVQKLSPYTREKFTELWDGLQGAVHQEDL